MGGEGAPVYPADCPPYSSIFSYLGVAFALSLTSIGSAVGTYKSAIGLFTVCAVHPELVFKCILPIIMAGIVGIYGLVTAVIIAPSMTFPYPSFNGYANFAGGLSVGFTGLASGICIGFAGNVAVRALAEQPKLIMGAMLILIFGEVLGLYGFIVSIILNTKKGSCP